MFLTVCGAFAGDNKSSPTSNMKRYVATTPAPSNSRTTFYDSSGRITGSAYTTRNGTTFRDNMGRINGRATTTYNFRDTGKK